MPHDRRWLTLGVIDDWAATEDVCRVFGLGSDIEVRAELHGGVNRVWRLRTEHGEYAVHQLLGLPDGLDVLERCAWVVSLELAAIAAGVHAPAPVLVPGSGAAAAVLSDTAGAFTVHGWYDASSVTSEATSEVFAVSLGDAVARIHSLGHPEPDAADVLDRRPTAEEWNALASRADAAQLSWASGIRAASGRLEGALRTVDDWDDRSAAAKLSSHRDLTSANILNDHGVAVLIDWESAGPTSASAEIGRTALDNFLKGDTLDHALLSAYLGGYTAYRPLPPIDLHWCSLWIRGLVVFAEQCAISDLVGSAPPALLNFQRRVVEGTPDELERRLRLAPALVEQFRAATDRT